MSQVVQHRALVRSRHEDEFPSGFLDQGADLRRTWYSTDKFFWLALTAILLGGAIVRIAYFSLDTSLWGDEAALALNLRDREFSQLAKPLDYNQHAPLLYLFVEKAVFNGFGLNEHALRFPSLVASLVALALFPWFASLMGSRTSVLVGTLLFAISPSLVRYGAELKPYSWDVVLTIAICLVAHRAHRAGLSAKWLAGFAALGVVSVWASFTSVFVLFATGATMIVDESIARRWKAVMSLCILCTSWLASFAIYYTQITRSSVQNSDLANFWGYYFAPLPPTSLWECRRLIEMALAPFSNPLHFVGAGLPAAFFLLGLIGIWKQQRRMAFFCLVPIVVTFIASGAHVYPFAQRLLLFLTPVFLLPIAFGVARTRTTASPASSLVVFVGLLVLTPLLGVNDLFEAPERSGVRDVLVKLSERVKDGDTIYLYYKARKAFRLYHSQSTLQSATIVLGSKDVRVEDRYRDDVDKLRGKSRVWLLFSESHKFFADEEKLMLAELDRRGKRLDTVHSAVTTAYLYDLSGEAR